MPQAGPDAPPTAAALHAVGAEPVVGGRHDVCVDLVVIRALNVPLFVAGHALTAQKQEAMLRLWYRLNTIRIVLCGGAWLAATQAQHRLPKLANADD
ncbi:hypothetical protein [Nocardia brasiliensis]|uniref:hypothetical protein n=1 Tax=Nocardia brasiliensis TaxID=37326 RepID=UPI0024572C63|nr:hypothetical protein [Nocardia brasiliensis]